MSQNSVKIGSFDLKNFELYSKKNNKPVNLKLVYSKINLFEDIYSNNLTMTFGINDSNNLLQNVPISGDEKIYIKFKTESSNQYFEKIFNLYKIEDRESDTEKSQRYNFHTITPEQFYNLQTKISKSYKNKKYSDIAQDVFQNFLFVKNAEIEETKYNYNYISPNIKPFEVLNSIAARSNSNINKGSNYFCFENSGGFKFISIESLISKPIRGTFRYEPKAFSNPTIKDEEDKQKRLNAIQSYKFNNHIDVIDNLYNGMYSNEMITHNLVFKQYSNYIFNYESTFDEYKHLEKSNNLLGKYYKKSSMVKFVSTTDGLDNPNNIEKFLQQRISLLQQLNNVNLSITIPGNTSLMVGDTIEIVLPSIEPERNKQQPLEKYYNGKYLIVSLKHSLSSQDFFTVLECVKDSTLTKLLE